MINWIKNHWKLLIIGLIACVLVISMFKACDLYNKTNMLKGQIKEWESKFTSLQKESEKTISNLTNAIDQKTKEIEHILSQPSPALEENKDLKKKLAELKEKEELASSLEQVVQNLREQNAVKDKIIENLEFTISQKNEQLVQLNETWKEKFDAQVQITSLKDAELQEALRGLQLKTNLTKSLESDLRTSRLIGTVKTGVVLGLAAVVVYGLLK